MPKERHHERQLPIVSGEILSVSKDLRKTKDREIVAACDGSGKGNAAVIFWYKGKLLTQSQVNLPQVTGVIPTSNICEYMAVCRALEILDRYYEYLSEKVWDYKKCLLVTDSKLVVHQVAHLVGQEDYTPWKINGSDLKKMANYLVSLWKSVTSQGRSLEIRWVSREDTIIWYSDAALRG